jgi:hypothetical protein
MMKQELSEKKTDQKKIEMDFRQEDYDGTQPKQHSNL